jgi:phosphatidylserine decarboxylase
LATVAHRKVLVIRADNKRIGKIALVFVGMMEVSSCVHTVKIGDRVRKGDEIGHFEFGGSTHAIIFQKKAKLKFSEGLYQADENGNLKSIKHNVHSFLAQLL